jgi:ADP-ribose pyrophosphatase YjhB (NUDIX family)
MSAPTASLAPHRVAAGTLLANGSRILLVHRSIYENGWDIPGAGVSTGESPAAACRRELREDLGLDRAPQRLLVVDWAPNSTDGDEILYIFDCGEARDDEVRIELGRQGLDRWEWVPIDRLADYVPPELARRFAQAHEARSNGSALYLEHGDPASTGGRGSLTGLSLPAGHHHGADR